MIRREGGAGAAGLLRQRLDNGGLKAGAQVRPVGAGEPALFRDKPVAGPAHCRLEAGKREVAAWPVEKRARQRKARGIAFTCLGFDRRAAGLGKAEELRHLVEGLAGCIVDGAAEATEAVGSLDGEKLAVPAGNEQHEVGKFDGLDQPRCERVPGEMVDAPERQPARRGKALGKHHTGKHAADEARARSDANRIHIGEGQARAGEGRLGHHIDPLGMGAGSDLGDDAAKGRVQALLAKDLGGEDLADRPAGLGAQEGGRGVVAAAFDPEDDARLRQGVPLPGAR